MEEQPSWEDPLKRQGIRIGREILFTTKPIQTQISLRCAIPSSTRFYFFDRCLQRLTVISNLETED